MLSVALEALGSLLHSKKFILHLFRHFLITSVLQGESERSSGLKRPFYGKYFFVGDQISIKYSLRTDEQILHIPTEEVWRTFVLTIPPYQTEYSIAVQALTCKTTSVL